MGAGIVLDGPFELWILVYAGSICVIHIESEIQVLFLVNVLAFD